MATETILLWVIWLTGLTAIVFCIPREQWREATVAYLISQAIFWLDGLIRVKFNWISFPIREFPKATDVSFTLEYFAYPAIVAFYSINRSRFNGIKQLLPLAIAVTGTTVLEVMLEAYTDLIEYVHFAWYWAWLNFLAIFIISDMYVRWFFKPGVFAADRRTAG